MPQNWLGQGMDASALNASLAAAASGMDLCGQCNRFQSATSQAHVALPGLIDQGSRCPTLSPRSTANLTSCCRLGSGTGDKEAEVKVSESFCWCFNGKFGAKSPSSIFGPWRYCLPGGYRLTQIMQSGRCPCAFRPYMGEAMAPSLMTSGAKRDLLPEDVQEAVHGTASSMSLPCRPAFCPTWLACGTTIELLHKGVQSTKRPGCPQQDPQKEQPC